MPAGRPTAYKREYCDVAVKLGKEGASLAQIACECGVIRETLWDWAKNNPEFSLAIARARELSMAWWEDQGRKGIWAGSGFNSQAWSRSMAARFPDDYREKQSIDLKAKVSVSEMDEEAIKAELVQLAAAGVLPKPPADDGSDLI